MVGCCSDVALSARLESANTAKWRDSPGCDSDDVADGDRARYRVAVVEVRSVRVGSAVVTRVRSVVAVVTHHPDPACRDGDGTEVRLSIGCVLVDVGTLVQGAPGACRSVFADHDAVERWVLSRVPFDGFAPHCDHTQHKGSR